MNWANEELATLDLGDERLDKRAVLLLEQVGSKARGQHSKCLRELG